MACDGSPFLLDLSGEPDRLHNGTVIARVGTVDDAPGGGGVAVNEDGALLPAQAGVEGVLVVPEQRLAGRSIKMLPGGEIDRFVDAIPGGGRLADLRGGDRRGLGLRGGSARFGGNRIGMGRMGRMGRMR